MKAPVWMVRFCALGITLLHLVVFTSLFVPYMADPRVSLWLTLLPSRQGLFVFSRVPALLMFLLVFVPLLLPVCAVWCAWKPSARLLSQAGLRVSLPLTCLACLFWSGLALELYAPASGLQGLLSRVLLVPPAAFALSAGCCFLAALSVRRLLTADVPLVAVQASAAGSEKSVPSARLLPAPAPFLLLSGGGLLCQALVIVGLSLPSTTTYDPYQHATWSTTGWQTSGLASPSLPAMLLLLAIPLLPLLAALLARWPKQHPTGWRGRLLVGAILLSYWLNLAAFLLSGIILIYTLLFLGTDANKQTHWLDAASGLPVLAFLLALFLSCCQRSLLFGYDAIN